MKPALKRALRPRISFRIATLAPRQSGLGKAFQQLRRELKERTEGQVVLKMYDGGVAGDEMTVVRKMRAGQLDGALLTSTGSARSCRKCWCCRRLG